MTYKCEQAKCWNAGADAAERGEYESECPYVSGFRRTMWMSGFANGTGMMFTIDGDTDWELGEYLYEDALV